MKHLSYFNMWVYGEKLTFTKTCKHMAENTLKYQLAL